MTVISIIGQTMHGPLNWEYSHNNDVRCFGAFFDLPTCPNQIDTLLDKPI